MGGVVALISPDFRTNLGLTHGGMRETGEHPGTSYVEFRHKPLPRPAKGSARPIDTHKGAGIGLIAV